MGTGWRWWGGTSYLPIPRGATRKFHLLHFSGPKRKIQLRSSSARAPRSRPHSFLRSSAEATGREVSPVGVWASRQRFTDSATSRQRRHYPTSPGRCANLRLRPETTHLKRSRAERVQLCGASNLLFCNCSAALRVEP